MKKKPNNHRSKHKDKRSYEGCGLIKQRSPTERKTSKYGVSTLLEEDSPSDDEE